MTKIIEECKNLKYEDRLIQTDFTLKESRTRGNLIETFKMVKGLNKTNYRKNVTIVQNCRTRGHRFKFLKNRSRLDIRKFL